MDSKIGYIGHDIISFSSEEYNHLKQYNMIQTKVISYIVLMDRNKPVMKRSDTPKTNEESIVIFFNKKNRMINLSPNG